MDFLAIDLETANADLSSICQVGLAVFRGGELAEIYSSLVNPNDYFDKINVSIHGICELDVASAPAFSEIYAEIERRAAGGFVVSHSLFDRTALNRAVALHHLSSFDCRWVDTIRIARRVWPQLSNVGFGLANLAREFEIAFDHHDAAEDARATGLILVRAIKESGMALDDLLAGSLHGLKAESAKITRQGNLDGKLIGEVAVFTGALSMPRKEAADLAALAGCEVEASVTKQTTLLIVGDQDVTRLSPGQEKSSKHLKAEALIAKGQALRVLRESDFRALIAG